MKKILLGLLLVTLSSNSLFGISPYFVLHTFAGESIDGGNPTGELIFDAKGNIFGTTSRGGLGCNLDQYGCGTVFELTPIMGGGWTYSIIYFFCPDQIHCKDGALPQGGLVIDANGNLYGTTLQGGTEASGTVFELSPPTFPGEPWTETVIHNFCGRYQCTDGYFPYSQLLIDAKGRLYGTTSAGGDNTNCRAGCGTVFRLSPPSIPDGRWTENVLYAFCTTPNHGYCPDGESPMIGLTADSSGNLYGTTAYGGSQNSDGHGTIYTLTPGPDGVWVESVLHSFTSVSAVGKLAIDAQGRIYAVIPWGYGKILRIDASGGHVQMFDLEQQAAPTSGVLVDSPRRTLYGTTTSTSGDGFGGIAFKITRSLDVEALHFFCDQNFCSDGGGPVSTLIQDSAGNLYGTTQAGGFRSGCGWNGYIYGCGVIFEITP